MIDRKVFAERIKELKKENKLSCSKLAMELQFKSKGSIGNFMNGKSLPSADNFGVSVDYLIGRTDKREINK